MNREGVVNAALSVVDNVGLEGVTIRAVAKATGAPPMSLYTHFARKDELLDLMHAEVFRRLYVDGGHLSWQVELAALCQQLRQTLLEHPRWIALLSRPAAATAMPQRERLLKLFDDDGMPLQLAAAAIPSAVLMSIGWVHAELTFRDPDGRSSLTTRFERIKSYVEESPTKAEHPMTQAMFENMPRLDLGDSFAFALRMFIAGLEATRQAQP